MVNMCLYHRCENTLTGRSNQRYCSSLCRKKDKRVRIREFAATFKENGCERCGYSRCLAALDFHHVDSSAKVISIAHCKTWKQLEDELAKCIVLCANCHREIHDELGIPIERDV